jgi:hypothetical protein
MGRRPIPGGFGVGRSVELFGKALVFGAGGVKITFCPLGADAQRVASLSKGSDMSVGCSGELVKRVLVVGADAGGLVGRGGQGVLGSDNGGGLGLAGSDGVLRGP